MKKTNNNGISQAALIMEYFEANPGRDIKHPEIVDWAIKEYRKRTGGTLRDPDRAIRKFHQMGYFIKISNGVYRFDPKSAKKRQLEDFSPEQKKIILERGGYKCAMCGKGEKDGVTLHIDHIKPKDFGGRAVLENGQVLCGPHNFLKKNFKQTETGKKMFINLYNLAKKENNQELIRFCSEILNVFEKNGINGHIKWIK